MKILIRATLFLLIMTLLTGVAYPLAVTGVAYIAFPRQAQGSLIEMNGKKYGSDLLAQNFSSEKHLWGRVISPDTSTFKDKSGKPLFYAWPSNLSPASTSYAALLAQRAEKIRAAHPDKAGQPVPVELVTCSGSGLDPHISVAAAEYQIGRLVANTALPEKKVQEIIARNTEGRLWGLFGEPRVNVLKVNLALDGIL